MANKSMADYRKQYRNNKILQRDKETLKAFSRVHKMNSDHLKKMNFSYKSLDRYMKTGVIEKVDYFNKSSQSPENYYKLTEYGKEWCNNNVFEEKQSFYSSTGIEHDLRIADIYTSLVEEKIDFTWHTEKDLQDQFNSRMEEIKREDYTRWEELQKRSFSASDFAYTTTTQTVMVEVITGSGSYTQSHLEAKEEFAQVLNSRVNFVR